MTAPASLSEARALLLSPLGPVARAGSNHDAVRVSFEFFPPKSDEAEANLWKAIRRRRWPRRRGWSCPAGGC